MLLKSQELVYDNYKPFFSQPFKSFFLTIFQKFFLTIFFMNARNKACRDHSCVKVSLQENWWDGNHFKMLVSFQQNDSLQFLEGKRILNGKWTLKDVYIRLNCNHEKWTSWIFIRTDIDISNTIQSYNYHYKPLIFTKLFSDYNPDSANDFKNNLKHTES